MNSIKKSFFWWIDLSLLIGYMILIYIVSSATVNTYFFFTSHIDKLYHAIEYSILGILWARVGFRLTKSIFWSMWLGSVMGALYGVSDEFHQYFVMGRGSDVGDIMADMVGALLGSLLLGWWLSSKKQYS